MTPLFKKLNYKEQCSIVSINHPKTFDAELEKLSGEATIITDLATGADIEFAICFVKTQNEINNFVAAICNKLKGDAIIWLCYPKMTSKNYKCDFNRDS